jgi:hypothetical protein
MRGPACTFWANLTPFSPQGDVLHEGFMLEGQWQRQGDHWAKKPVTLGLGRIVTLYYRSSTLHQIH